jgi:hypothetical protein
MGRRRTGCSAKSRRKSSLVDFHFQRRAAARLPRLLPGISEGSPDREIVRRLDYALNKATRKTRILSVAAVPAGMAYRPDFESLRHAVSLMEGLDRTGNLLPDDWAFRGLTVREFRLFWHALRAIARLHASVVAKAIPPPAVPTSRLLVCFRGDLVKWICQLVDIEPTRADEILGYHLYERTDHKPDITLTRGAGRCGILGKSQRTDHKPDIALTPLLPVGSVLVAAPSIVFSSSFERNLCAHLLQVHGDEFAASTRQCAGAMARKLRDCFRSHGFLAETNIDIGSTDIDLPVHSPVERFVLSAELRWCTPTADVAEVFNRGEKDCLKKLRDQLPKHREVLSTNPGGLLARVFGVQDEHAVRGFGCMLITRGFVGTPRMRADPFVFCDDRLVLMRLATAGSLSSLFHWCREMPDLPINDKDFRIVRAEVTTPSGIRIVHHETVCYKITP